MTTVKETKLITIIIYTEKTIIKETKIGTIKETD